MWTCRRTTEEEDPQLLSRLDSVWPAGFCTSIPTGCLKPVTVQYHRRITANKVATLIQLQTCLISCDSFRIKVIYSWQWTPEPVKPWGDAVRRPESSTLLSLRFPAQKWVQYGSEGEAGLLRVGCSCEASPRPAWRRSLTLLWIRSITGVAQLNSAPPKVLVEKLHLFFQELQSKTMRNRTRLNIKLRFTVCFWEVKRRQTNRFKLLHSVGVSLTPLRPDVCCRVESFCGFWSGAFIENLCFFIFVFSALCLICTNTLNLVRSHSDLHGNAAAAGESFVWNNWIIFKWNFTAALRDSQLNQEKTLVFSPEPERRHRPEGAECQSGTDTDDILFLFFTLCHIGNLKAPSLDYVHFL